jgi:hypothetical protein
VPGDFKLNDSFAAETAVRSAALSAAIGHRNKSAQPLEIQHAIDPL